MSETEFITKNNFKPIRGVKLLHQLRKLGRERGISGPYNRGSVVYWKSKLIELWIEQTFKPKKDGPSDELKFYHNMAVGLGAKEMPNKGLEYWKKELVKIYIKTKAHVFNPVVQSVYKVGGMGRIGVNNPPTITAERERLQTDIYYGRTVKLTIKTYYIKDVNAVFMINDKTPWPGQNLYYQLQRKPSTAVYKKDYGQNNNTYDNVVGFDDMPQSNLNFEIGDMTKELYLFTTSIGVTNKQIAACLSNAVVSDSSGKYNSNGELEGYAYYKIVNTTLGTP